MTVSPSGSVLDNVPTMVPASFSVTVLADNVGVLGASLISVTPTAASTLVLKPPVSVAVIVMA